MKELIEYLERKIELCTEMNMPLEKFAYTDALKKARALQLQQIGVIGCFSSLEECENEAILFTKDKLKVVSELLSEDYKTGYKEGVEHYLASKNNL